MVARGLLGIHLALYARKTTRINIRINSIVGLEEDPAMEATDV